MTTERAKGNRGEQLARDFLINCGYTIIERNYNEREGEIDIIAENGKYIIFAEVKTRKYDCAVRGAEAVTKSKQKKIIATAQKYLMKHKTNNQPRFDVLEIYEDGMQYEINHIKNAFSVEAEYELF